MKYSQRYRLRIGQLAAILGETRRDMAFWLKQCDVPLHQARLRGWRWVMVSDLRVWSPEIWGTLLEAEMANWHDSFVGPRQIVAPQTKVS